MKNFGKSPSEQLFNLVMIPGSHLKFGDTNVENRGEQVKDKCKRRSDSQITRKCQLWIEQGLIY